MMHSPNAFGWIGRRQRRDCAYAISDKLVIKLSEAGAPDECELLVSPSLLTGFRSRPLGKTVHAQLRQLSFRILSELNKKLTDPTSVVLEPHVEDGRVQRLIVKAIRSRTPIA